MDEIWAATRDVAISTEGSQPVARYASVLNGKPVGATSRLHIVVPQLLLSGNLDAQPFLLSLRVGWHPGVQAIMADPGSEQFRADAIAMTKAGLGLVEWLRSRMPRYPIRFKLPYTNPFSTRVVNDGFPDAQWPWLLSMRREGFQAMATVAKPMAEALEVPELPLRDALARLQDALVSSAPWQGYLLAAAAIDGDAEAVLTELAATYRDSARSEAVDVVEPRLALRRMQHRQAALRAVEHEAAARGGVVADYYRAFRRVDRTLAGITALLGQLLFYGEPRVVEWSRASWRRDIDGWIEPVIQTEEFQIRLNEVIQMHADVPALSGFLVVEGMFASFRRHADHFIGGTRAFGTLLVG